jgi:hypothetical protein
MGLFVKLEISPESLTVWSKIFVTLFVLSRRRKTEAGNKNTVEFLEKSNFSGELSLDEVMPQVYDELHRLASAYMHRKRQGHILQPTALVNETYLRLIGQHSVDFRNRFRLA